MCAAGCAARAEAQRVCPILKSQFQSAQWHQIVSATRTSELSDGSTIVFKITVSNTVSTSDACGDILPAVDAPPPALRNRCTAVRSNSRDCRTLAGAEDRRVWSRVSTERNGGR